MVSHNFWTINSRYIFNQPPNCSRPLFLGVNYYVFFKTNPSCERLLRKVCFQQTYPHIGKKQKNIQATSSNHGTGVYQENCTIVAVSFQENYNTPVEHTRGNPPRLWKESRLIANYVKVANGVCSSSVCWNNLGMVVSTFKKIRVQVLIIQKGHKLKELSTNQWTGGFLRGKKRSNLLPVTPSRTDQPNVLKKYGDDDRIVEKTSTLFC